MDFRIRQLKRSLEPLREALESHHRSLEGLESAILEFEETFNEPEQKQERPQAQHKGQARRSRRLPGGAALPANIRTRRLNTSRPL
jgi:chromosome segregation ATPase